MVSGGSADIAGDFDTYIDRMSLAEKVGQMTQVEVTSFDIDEVGELFTDLQIGGCLFGGGEPPSYDPTTTVEGINELQAYNIDHSEHGIPFVLGLDALHGNAVVDGATVYPHNCGLGATRNPELVSNVSRETGTSVRAIGAHWNFSPTADVQRDPRWGRFYEGFSESPYLTGDLAEATIEGHRSAGICSCVKHIAGYSVAENGKDRSPSNVSIRDLRTNVFPAYQRALESDPETIMVSSGSINGIPAHASTWLLTTMLRDRWGYDGVVVSDWRDFERMQYIHDFVSSYREAIKRGINAGVDMLMNPEDPASFISIVVELVESGEIEEDRIDDAVRNILQFKRNAGLFEDPFVDETLADDVVGANREVALDAVEQSLTLLRNEDGALPIADTIDSLLLAGPATDSAMMQMGGWTLGWQSIGNGQEIAASPAVTTIYRGLQDAVSPDTSIVHEPTGFTHEPWSDDDTYTFENEPRIRSAAADADAVVLTLGEGPYAEYLGDRDGISLPEAQRRLVESVADVVDDDTPLVGVILAGRPRGGAETLSQLDAVLMAYLPGTAGGTGVADVLFGRTNPSGRLPFTWPRKDGDFSSCHNSWARLVSPPEDHIAAFDREPLYEFGHGLSYTTFEYTDLSVSPQTVSDPAEQRSVSVSVTVENVGDRYGDHVVDVHATESYGSVKHPRSRLLGYDRVGLDAGDSETVEIQIPLRRLEIVPGDVLALDEKVVEAGTYTLSVGDTRTTLAIEESGAMNDRGPIGRV